VSDETKAERQARWDRLRENEEAWAMAMRRYQANKSSPPKLPCANCGCGVTDHTVDDEERDECTQYEVSR